MASNYSNPVSTILPVESGPMDSAIYFEPLEIIAQPCYSSRLRYRSDFEKSKNRRAVLRSLNNPNYRGPAIRIPQPYLDVTQQYYIRVCLVTVINEQTNYRYIHPYELEDVEVNEYNDRLNNAVLFPIESDDKDGIKCFPNLRIVKKTASDLKNYGDLRVFDLPGFPAMPQLAGPKDTIREFNLDRLQLAFTLGKKTIVDGSLVFVAYACTTQFSDELVKVSHHRESDSDNAPTESTRRTSDTLTSSTCRIYKYAPQSGSTNSNDEVLIFFRNKLRSKKYGDLQIKFEYDTPLDHWSESVLDLVVEDQMVSFRTPCFPFLITSRTTVDIVIKQNKRTFEKLTFDYIPPSICSHCQTTINPVAQTNPNKRTISDVYDEEIDNAVNITENNPEPDMSSSLSTLQSVSVPLNNEDASQQILDKLADSIALLFSNKDFIPVLRICRPFIRKRPELLHQAINNNYSDLVSNFISVAGMELLQKKNEHGETVLLHAARLNRIHIVRAVLQRKECDELLEDKNNKGQNIFHILALNTDLNEILDLIIDHLLKKSIEIRKKFHYADQDNYTPLQLAILNDNLSAIDRLYN